MQKRQHNLKNLYFSYRIVMAMNGFLDYPITIVEAPMGYGKTTFVREKLKNTNAVVLWQKIYDNKVDTYVLQQNMRLRLPKSILTNMAVEMRLGIIPFRVWLQRAMRLR